MKKLALQALALLFATLSASAQISMPSAGTTYTQDFNTLATDSTASIKDYTTTTWAQNSTLPGWYLFTVSNNPDAVKTYLSKDGNATVGSFWSYGVAGTSDRALGSQFQQNAPFYDKAFADVQNATTEVGYITVALKNTSSGPLGGVALNYTGEQWRESNAQLNDTIRVDYGVGDTFASVTTWVPAGDAFYFTTPVHGDSDAPKPLNGNLTANRVPNLGGTITTAWNPGQTLWIRWVEINDAAIDHGWAIDDVSVTANAAIAVAAPVVTLQPQTQTVNAGDPVTLTVTANSTESVTYQWIKDNSPINGATSPTYSIASAAGADSGSYKVTVTNSGGPTTSDAAVLTVNVPVGAPQITQQPLSQSVVVGTDITLSVTATGSSLTYQWSKDGSPISGATAPTLSLPSAQISDSGSYTVAVSTTTTVTSTAAVISVTTPHPTVSTQPVSQTLIAGNALNLSVTAAGAGPFTYQWSKDGSSIDGATAATFALSHVAVADAGSYTVVITNGGGMATSNPAVIAVAHPTFWVSPAGNDSAAGTEAQPWLTIGHARDIIKSGGLNVGMTEDIIVNFKAGDYYIASVLNFGTADSGSNGYSIVYRSVDGPGLARLHGGSQPTGWELTGVGSSIWRVNIGVGKSATRTLFENGRPADLARSPNRVVKPRYTPYLGDYRSSAASGAGTSSATNYIQYKAGEFDPSLWTVTSVASVTWWSDSAYHNWGMDKGVISAIDTGTRKFTFANDGSVPSGAERYFVQGIFELLDAPGEFFYDSVSGWLYYYPRDGAPASQDIRVPTTNTIIGITGTAPGTHAHHLKFDGFTVAFSRSTGGGNGAVVLQSTDHIEIRNCHFTAIGDSAICMEDANAYNTVYGCEIEHCGTGGIWINNTLSRTTYPNDLSEHNLISNCQIHDLGEITVSPIRTVGVLLECTNDCEVSHCDIYNSARYGISLRGHWSTQWAVPDSGLHFARNNHFDYIRLTDCETDSGDAGILHVAHCNGSGDPNGAGNINFWNQITVSGGYEDPGMDDWKSFGIYCDHPMSSLYQNFSNIKVTWVEGAQFHQNDNPTQTTSNVNWTGTFDESQMQYDQIGLLADFPAAYNDQKTIIADDHSDDYSESDAVYAPNDSVSSRATPQNQPNSSWSDTTIGNLNKGDGRYHTYNSTGNNQYAQWRPILPHAGTYEVWAWKMDPDVNASTVARYTVYFDGGTQDVTVNQKTGAAGWVLLGTKSFLAGRATNSGYVRLFTDSADGKAVRADAIKFVDVTAPPALPEQTIAFADLASKVYGADPFALTATASSGLPVALSVVSGPATLSGNVLTITGAGTVSLNAHQAGSDSYQPAADVQQTLTVTKAPLTAKANDKSRLPNTANPTFTIAYSGFVYADTKAVLISEPTAATAATTESPIGTYPITLSGGSADNYDLTLQDGTLTVSADAPVTVAQSITFAPLAAKTYGDGSFAVTATASSSLPVKLSVVSGPATISNGTITLTGTGIVRVRAEQAGNAGFDPASSVDQTFTVGKAIVTATADSKSRGLGADNPAFTISYTGFVNGDTKSVLTSEPTASTTATSDSPAGSYPITLFGGSADNYLIALKDGSLTVLSDPTGNYFGTFGSGTGHWALTVRADKTATYLAYLPDRHSVLVVDLTIDALGHFSTTSTELVAQAVATRSALDTATRSAASASAFTLTGQITGNAVSGQLDGLNTTFTGAADASGSAPAGLYTASALGTTSGTTYAIVGASGQTVVVTTLGTSVDGATGTVDGSGQLTAATGNGGQLALTLNAQNQSVSATLTPTGSAPVSFSGLAETVASTARLVNISTRAFGGTGDSVAIGGFVLSGSSAKRVLLRAVGPTLTSQGLGQGEVMSDPVIDLHHGADIVASNDNWGDNANAADIVTVSSQIGAAGLASGDSKSSALLLTLQPGVYSFVAHDKASASGIVLVEVYDADDTRGNSALVNISSRVFCATGDSVAIGGYVVTGNAPKHLLIRAVGPTLTTQGLGQGEIMADPLVEIHHGADIIASNDNWGDNADPSAIVTATSLVGAAPLAGTDTKSSALLITLQPGVYSFVVHDKSNASGIVLLEVYDAD